MTGTNNTTSDVELMWIDYFNLTLFLNATPTFSPEQEELELAQQTLYPPFLAIMILFCFFAVLINVVVLMSVCWIRRPLSPTLQFSLWLAGADVWTSVLIAVHLAINSLPVILPMKKDPPVDDTGHESCYLLFLEMLRMGGIYTTLAHLLALAFNHYLGITKPLQYPLILTNRNITVVSLLLWILPPGGLIFYCWLLDNDGFSVEGKGCTIKFIMKADFRRTISLVFFTSAAVIFFIYLHIFFLVKRHQANRNRFRRVGSTYSRTNVQTENQQAHSNEKAYRTTLLIVGSVFIGFFPACTYFMLVCNMECLISPPRSPWIRILTAFFNNFLIILKTLINSYIYAARMHEIKNAIRRMRLSFTVKCCKLGSQDINGIHSDYSRNLSRTSTRRSKKTVVCRLQSIPRHDGRGGNVDREAYSTPL